MHWCCTERVKADILTKIVTAKFRQQFRAGVSYTFVPPVLVEPKGGPSIKRDVSADGAIIDNVKLGLGGMAAIPLLAVHCQQALIGQAAEIASFEQAAQILSKDVTPMTDVRASREYRSHVVQRLLVKCGKQLVAEMQAESA